MASLLNNPPLLSQNNMSMVPTNVGNNQFTTISQFKQVNPMSPPMITTTVVPTSSLYGQSYYYPPRMDNSLNSNYFEQKRTTQNLRYRILDKWFYQNELCYLLNYLKIENGRVKVIDNISEYKNSKSCTDNANDIEKKTDYIGEEILDINTMRKLLIKICEELYISWTELTKKESIVVHVVEKYLRKKLKKMIPNSAARSL